MAEMKQQLWWSVGGACGPSAGASKESQPSEIPSYEASLAGGEGGCYLLLCGMVACCHGLLCGTVACYFGLLDGIVVCYHGLLYRTVACYHGLLYGIGACCVVPRLKWPGSMHACDMLRGLGVFL